MADAAVLYNPVVRFTDSNGDALSGGKVFTYEPGTSTLKTSYQDQALTTPHANPIILDSNGEEVVWLDGLYKINVLDSSDVQQANFPVDDFSTAPAAAAATEANQWIATGDVTTFISSTSFSVPNDKTSTYTVGRRVQCVVTAGTVYGRVSASSFGASITTVTVVLDSGNLDSGLSAVSVGIITPNNHSIPKTEFDIDDATTLISPATAQQISSGELVYVVDTGAADAYVMTLVPAITTYTTGQELGTKIVNANLTTTPTVEVNGLGAKTIKREDGSALIVGDLPANHPAIFRYDGTDMLLLNPATLGAATGSTLTATDLTLTGAAASPPDANTLVKDNIIKGWVLFDGTGTIAIQDSFNVASLVDNGTGLYDINWDTDFANANYSLAGFASGGSGIGHRIVSSRSATPMAVGTSVISIEDAAAALQDAPFISVIAIGDQ